MREPHVEGVATHDDPESCGDARKCVDEALTGARAGTVLSRETRHSRAPTPLPEAEGHMCGGRQRESSASPARSQTRRTHGTFLRENREIPKPPADEMAGRTEKATGRTAVMDGSGKSDGAVVPAKSPNKAGRAAAEAMEGRAPAKGNTDEQNAPRTQCRTSVPSALERVRQRACTL